MRNQEMKRKQTFRQQKAVSDQDKQSYDWIEDARKPGDEKMVSMNENQANKEIREVRNESGRHTWSQSGNGVCFE